MRYKLLGRSGLRVSEMCLGTMTFGEDWGWGASRDESKAQYDAFTEAGGNFVDTANLYTNGSSEKLVGEFVKADRERIVLATKYTMGVLRPGDPNGNGNHRKNLVQSVHNSLKRLDTDYVDLLWVHAYDLLTPVDEMMRALDDLVTQGKVLYIGVSDAPAWIVSQANTLADWRGWTPFTALQIEYSLLQRTVESDLLPMARAFDLAVTPWSPLAGGVLTGKYNKPREDGQESRYAEGEKSPYINDKNLQIAQLVVDIAGEVGASPAQVALAWLLEKGRHHDGVMIPIVGARKTAQLTDNLGALDVRLTDEQIARLNDISAYPLPFPQSFVNDDRVNTIVYGGTRDLIDTHRPSVSP
ncbi:MAG: aldo/keto reductase [Armatimonadetes bacterium]|nr:aldo/keto reductase [Armatimonadota bacterium]